jgi:polygalacturonase
MKTRDTHQARSPRPRGDGIHDDTAAIQALLDSRSPLVLLPPSAAGYLISGTLRIHSGQCLMLDRFTRVRLARGSDCLMLTNADHDAGDVNVAVSGGVWDMNNLGQSPNPLWAPPPQLLRQTGYRHETYLGIGMRFVGVTGLSLTGMTLKDPTTFCVQLSKVRQFTVDDIRFDFNRGNPQPVNMDGIHVDGGCAQGRITNLKGATYDDLVALNANDGLDSPFQGPIEDIEIDGIFAENAHSAVRILSSEERAPVRRVSISNVFGTFYQYCVGITAIDLGRPIHGTFDDITLRGFYVSKADRLSLYQKDDQMVFPIVYVDGHTNVGTLSISEMHRHERSTPIECVRISTDAVVDRLYASRCTYENLTGRAAPFIVNEGRIGLLAMHGVHAPGERLLDNSGQIGRLETDAET